MKNMKNKRYFIMIIIIISLFLSVGFSSINAITLDIKGQANANPQDGIFIVDVINNDIDNYKTNSMYQTLLDGKVILEKNNNNSTITINTYIYNSYSEQYIFKGIEYSNDPNLNTYDNTNITFECDKVGEIIYPGETMIVTTTFKYKDNANLEENMLNFLLNYKFEKNTWDGVTLYGFDNASIITSQNEQSISIDYTNVGGQYEKINLPLKNLEIGQLYQLTFSVSNINTIISTNSTLIYGCTVMDTPNTNYTNSKALIVYDGYNNGFMWKSITTDDATATISFIATQETMYWIWDLSKVSDKNATFNLSNVSIAKSPKPSSPYIDLPNTTIYQKEYLSGDQEATLTLDQGTFLVKASYDDLVVRLQSAGGYEFVNIPIVGLTSGKSYTINFTNNTTASASSHKYGTLVQASKQEGGNQLVTDSNFIITEFNKPVSGSVTFTATNSTMYWVWDCGGIQDYMWTTINLYDIKLIAN